MHLKIFQDSYLTGLNLTNVDRNHQNKQSNMVTNIDIYIDMYIDIYII